MSRAHGMHPQEVFATAACVSIRKRTQDIDDRRCNAPSMSNAIDRLQSNAINISKEGRRTTSIREAREGSLSP